MVEYVSHHLSGLTVFSSLADQLSATATTTADASAASAPILCTHNGSFHCDEAMACGLLRHTPEFKTAVIVRTRDAKDIAAAAIVVDVGTVYDPATLRFDHHQSSFHDTMTTAKKKYQTRLSSAGLIFKHYGRSIIQQYVLAVLQSPARAAVLAMTKWAETRTALTEAELDVVEDALYAQFIEQVDGIDNGVEAFRVSDPSEGSSPATLQPNYKETTNLSSRVGGLHPAWNEEGNGDAVVENAAFVEAVEMASLEFFQALSSIVLSWLPARTIVEQAFLSRKTDHPSGRLLLLRESFCPWKDHLLALEEQHGCVGEVLYVLFSDGKGWRVQAVPKAITGFENRRPLPFRGLRDEALSEACGCEGGVFVHVSGFIGGMKTFDGAMQLAEKALAQE